MGTFNKTWTSYEMPTLLRDYKIGAALINKFFAKIESNKDDPIRIAEQMKRQTSTSNEFSNIVNRNYLQSQVKHFTEEDADQAKFPFIDLAELKLLTLGSYQIKQAMPYIVEHLKRNEKFLLYKCPQDILKKYFSNLTHSKVEHLGVYLSFMYSRFRKNSKHVVYVLVDFSLIGRNGIIGHTCDCRHGLRVVGCCSHISALISYLGFYRHDKEKIKPVASFMDNFFEH